MPDKKAPVIVVKKSQLKAPAADPLLPEPRAETAKAPVVPDTAGENTAPLTRKPFNRQARKTREKIAHFARTFPALWPDFNKGPVTAHDAGHQSAGERIIEAHPDSGMSFGLWIVAVRQIISRIEFQRCVKEGCTRYDIHGEPAGEVTARDIDLFSNTALRWCR